MKNLFLSLAFMLIGSLSFANYSNVKTETSKAETKEVVKPKIYNVYCNGGSILLAVVASVLI